MDKLSYVCTMGPSTDNYEILEKMYSLGMTSIRINMSYKHPKLMNLIELAKEFKKNNPEVELMFDSAGPEIRIILENDIAFKQDDIIILGKDFNLTIDNSEFLEIGDTISIKDGDYVFEIVDKNVEGIHCKAYTDGIIKHNNKIYNEKMYNNLAFISEYDEDTIKLAVENDIDAFAISFVRDASNITEIKNVFKRYGKEDIKLIAKIENKLAIENLENIIKVSDEIMVARGDLSTILPRTDIGYYQKLISKECQDANVPVMIATGIMNSMEHEEDPKISEILDLYNIIEDGISKIVFTSETSVSEDPIDILETANDIFASANKII